MSLFCLKPLSGFLWLSVRAFSRLGPPLPALHPLLCPPGPFLIPEEALPRPTLTSPSAWSHLPGSLSHWLSLTPDVASLPGGASPAILSSLSLFTSFTLSGFFGGLFIVCLLSLEQELHKPQAQLSGALLWAQ